MNPVAALALAASLAGAGRALGWLTAGGAAAAGLIGTVVFTGGGMRGAALLALLFVSGSVLTRSATGARPGRTAPQVLANGTMAAIGAALIPFHQAGWPILVGALAAAQADTWATEIGASARRPTRLVTTGAQVSPGTSGGVSWRGTGGGFGGAAVMATTALVVGAPATTGISALAGGIVGSFADSVLGATLQARYRCDACAADADGRRHRCGRPTRYLRGWRWLNNDAVNLVATALGGVVALGIEWGVGI